MGTELPGLVLPGRSSRFRNLGIAETRRAGAAMLPRWGKFDVKVFYCWSSVNEYGPACDHSV